MTSFTTDHRIRTFRFSNNSSTVQVVWHQGKEDDDVVQLLNPVEDNVSEEIYFEEEGFITSLPVEAVKPTLFQADKYNVTADSVVEGLSVVEMQLIR
ncbi:unnamed protein product [Angiostrongylus costaricensis]|uniref:Alpha-glucosidase n=1 Tax=Angiostrongylus costaricensis TaxID=334426 RepID=A0A0R3PID6_ANGCS|nr:unnamed protein product [Angiostrongylus costaricensis]